MRDQSWQYLSSANSQLTPTDTDSWLWEGRPKSFQPSCVVAETENHAPSWTVTIQRKSEMQHANTSFPGTLDDQQQQQFMDYWSRQDDRILSPYMPGYQAQPARPHSPALASTLREGKQPAYVHVFHWHLRCLSGPESPSPHGLCRHDAAKRQPDLP